MSIWTTSPLWPINDLDAFRKSTVMTRIHTRVVRPMGHDGCWIWMGALNGCGYAQIKCEEVRMMVHRITYQHHRGPIPEGLELDHKCRVRFCVNPYHLEPVTTKTNILRGFGRGAIEARMTHCKNGHPLEGANLLVRKNGHRRCRICLRAWFRDWYKRKRNEHANKLS